MTASAIMPWWSHRGDSNSHTTDFESARRANYLTVRLEVDMDMKDPPFNICFLEKAQQLQDRVEVCLLSCTSRQRVRHSASTFCSERKVQESNLLHVSGGLKVATWPITILATFLDAVF